MSTILLNSDLGRSAIRRFELLENPTDPNQPAGVLTDAQVTEINTKYQALDELATKFGCPDSDL